eukprot:Nk52_evm32s2531 gene=Nk52_evmTU32s2531
MTFDASTMDPVETKTKKCEVIYDLNADELWDDTHQRKPSSSWEWIKMQRIAVHKLLIHGTLRETYVPVASVLCVICLIGISIPFIVEIVRTMYPEWYPYGDILGSLGSVYVMLALLLIPKTLSIFETIFLYSFEHLIGLHIWLGRLSLFVLLLHGAAYFPNWVMEYRILKFHLTSFPFINGTISTLALIVLNVSSLSYFRRKYHHIFVPVHLTSFAVFFVCGALHNIKFLYYGAPPLVIYWGDYIYRYFKKLHRVQLHSSSKLIGSDYVKITFKTTSSMGTIGPGSYFYLRYSYLSKFQWHPFSVSDITEDGSVRIYVKKTGDWTDGFVSSLLCVDKAQDKDIRHIDVEGPHGRIGLDLGDYNNFFLSSGGIGVTPNIFLLHEIIRRYEKGQMRIRQIVFVWSVRSVELLNEFLPKLEQLYEKHMAILRLHIHLTATGKTEPAFEHSSIGIVKGKRASLSSLLESYYGYLDKSKCENDIETSSTDSDCDDSAPQDKVGVFVCGPSNMTSELAQKCNMMNWEGEGKVLVHFHKEVFEL